MEKYLVTSINEYFKRLIEMYGFRIKTEVNNEQYYMIEFIKGDLVIKIEQHFQAFYATVYKLYTKGEIGIFNLLGYLKQGGQAPEYKFFRRERKLKNCYKKQFSHLSTVIYENYTLLDYFFNEDDYELRFVEFENYWRNKHPWLYDTVDEKWHTPTPRTGHA